MVWPAVPTKTKLLWDSKMCLSACHADKQWREHVFKTFVAHHTGACCWYIHSLGSRQVWHFRAWGGGPTFVGGGTDGGGRTRGGDGHTLKPGFMVQCSHPFWGSQDWQKHVCLQEMHKILRNWHKGALILWECKEVSWTNFDSSASTIFQQHHSCFHCGSLLRIGHNDKPLPPVPYCTGKYIERLVQLPLCSFRRDRLNQSPTVEFGAWTIRKIAKSTFAGTGVVCTALRILHVKTHLTVIYGQKVMRSRSHGIR